MTAVEPGGARVPADPERLAEAEAFTRGAVEYDATGALALFVAEYDRRGAALAAAASRNALNAGSAAEWVKQREKALAEVGRLREECNATADTVLELAAQRGAALADCRDLQREVELLRGQVGAWDSAQAVWDAIGRIRKSLGGDTDV